jgi:hypothetical protein
MRGESKKIRVKHSKEIRPAVEDVIDLKAYFSLNTDFNKQYMKANKLSGWEQVRTLPVEELVVPVNISDEYRIIKESIKQNVLLASEFERFSHDISSLHGEENFV